MQLIGGYDDAVAQWAGHQLGVTFELPYTAFALIDFSRQIVGATVFNDYHRGGSIEMTHVGRMGRHALAALAAYAFIQNDASRVTCKTMRANSSIGRILSKAGFVFEGTMKRYYGPTKAHDALIFALFRENAGRWLKGSMQ